MKRYWMNYTVAEWDTLDLNQYDYFRINPVLETTHTLIGLTSEGHQTGYQGSAELTLQSNVGRATTSNRSNSALVRLAQSAIAWINGKPMSCNCGTYRSAIVIGGVTLRNPIFGDTEQSNMHTIIRDLVSGQRDIFKPTVARGKMNWFTAKRLSFSFQMMTNTDAFLAMLYANQGLEVTLIDQYNREWLGLIISDVVEIKRRIACDEQWSFDFEGRRV